MAFKVSADELRALFEELHIWDKIRDGRLLTEEVEETRTPSHSWPGATSIILRHRTADGVQIATTHRISFPDGTTPYWSEKDLRVGGIVVTRPDVTSSR